MIVQIRLNKEPYKENNSLSEYHRVDHQVDNILKMNFILKNKSNDNHNQWLDE